MKQTIFKKLALITGVLISSAVCGQQIDLAHGVKGLLPLTNVAPATGASKILGRGSDAGAGSFQELTLGSGLTLTGLVLSSAGGGSGTVNAGTTGQFAYYSADGTTLSGVALPSLTGTPAAGMSSYWTGATTQALFTYGSALQLNQAGAAPIDYAGSTITAGQMPTAISATGVLTGTATPTLGASGTLGNITFGNGTSGTLKITPPATGAMGTSVITLPIGTTDFSGTGGTSQVVKQVSAGAPLTVARLACADLSDSAAGCSSAGGSGTVTAVSVTTANGVSGSVATETTTPAITLALGDITPSSVASTGAVSGTTITPSQNIVIGGTESVTAGTTQTQAGATNLSASVAVHVITVGTSSDGVRMPAIVQRQLHCLRNASTVNSMKVYGAGTDTINEVATATGVSFGYNLAVCLIPDTATNWKTLSIPRFLAGGSNPTALVNADGSLTIRTPNTDPVRVAMASTNAVLASGGCTGAAIGAVGVLNGTARFQVNVGTGCTGSQPLVFTLPAATNGWNCYAQDSSNAAGNAPAQSSAISATSVTVTNYSRTTGLAAAWTDSDLVVVSCLGG